MSPSLLNKIPEEVREHVKMLLSVTPTVRPDADQMTKVCIVSTCKDAKKILYHDVLMFVISVYVFV